MGMVKLHPLTQSKPRNRLRWNFAQLITSTRRASNPKFVPIGRKDASWWYWRDWTTAIHCFMAHIPAVSRHYSVCKTTLLVLFCKHRGGATLSSICLELTTFIHHSQRLSGDLQISAKNLLFRLAFDCSVNALPRHISSSASEVTTLWNYINQFIVIILIYSLNITSYRILYRSVKTNIKKNYKFTRESKKENNTENTYQNTDNTKLKKM